MRQQVASLGGRFGEPGGVGSLSNPRRTSKSRCFQLGERRMTLFKSTIRVRSYELDSFGHLNHSVYLNYFEQGRFEALSKGGFGYDEILRRGWAVHVARAEIDYRSELRLDDEVVIETRMAAYTRTSMTLAQEMWRISRLDSAPRVLSAEARIVAVWIGNGGRPMRVPEEIRGALGEPQGGV
jgi:YbgC/YbaW family acyl-CoA thioester hydrolase